MVAFPRPIGFHFLLQCSLGSDATLILSHSYSAEVRVNHWLVHHWKRKYLKNMIRTFPLFSVIHLIINIYPTALCRVQITTKTSTKITWYYFFTSEDLLDRFSCNVWDGLDWSYEKKKKKFGVLDNKSLIRCCVVSLIIFTHCLYFDSLYGLVKIRHNS